MHPRPRAQDTGKRQAAQRWVAAVNRWGELGQWRFEVCRDPQPPGKELEQMVGVEAALAGSM